MSALPFGLLAIIVALLLGGQSLAGVNDGDTWQPFRDMEDAQGVVHTDCLILEGPTSIVRCADGFTESS